MDVTGTKVWSWGCGRGLKSDLAGWGPVQDQGGEVEQSQRLAEEYSEMPLTEVEKQTDPSPGRTATRMHYSAERPPVLHSPAPVRT